MKDVDYYLGLHADELVILDEVQNYPDLFMSLSGVIDARRREGRGNGRFLILGFASNELLKQSSESLAGCVHYCELTGLNPFETEKPEGEPLERLWMRGGFPDSYARSNQKTMNGVGTLSALIRNAIFRNWARAFPLQRSCVFGRCWHMRKVNRSTLQIWQDH